MDINKLNMPEEVGEVMDRRVEFQIFCHSLKHEIHGFRSAGLKEGECWQSIICNAPSLWLIFLTILIVSEGYGIIHVNKRSTVWRKKK